MTTKLQNVGIDVLLLIALSVAGWVYNAGTLSAQLNDTRERLALLENKMDRLLYNLGEGPAIKEIPPVPKRRK